MPNPVVNIWLEEDSTGSLVPKCAPDPVHVSAYRGESVVWQCAEGSAKIVFRGGGPFRSSNFDVPTSGFVGSGLPLRGTPGLQYKYDIIVIRPGDGRKYELDPQVIVDNGG